MDPRLLRISRSWRHGKTRFEVASDLGRHGPATTAIISDRTGLDVTRVEWALYGSTQNGRYFRPSASLIATGVVVPKRGRGDVILEITDLGRLALEETAANPSFAFARGAKGRAATAAGVTFTAREVNVQ